MVEMMVVKIILSCVIIVILESIHHLQELGYQFNMNGDGITLGLDIQVTCIIIGIQLSWDNMGYEPSYSFSQCILHGVEYEDLPP